MNLESLSMLGQAVGGFVVVLSLIYLARQVHQNSKLLVTENYARMLDRMSAVQSRLSTDPEYNHIFLSGAQSPGGLSPAERTRFSWANYELFGAGEFMYHQAQEDALPPEVWERWRATIAWWIWYPGMQAWWNAKPTPFTSDYEEFVEDLIEGDAVDRTRMDRWERFVAGEELSGVEGDVAAEAPPSGCREA